jgi:gliding motility-associated-like protein
MKRFIKFVLFFVFALVTEPACIYAQQINSGNRSKAPNTISGTITSTSTSICQNATGQYVTLTGVGVTPPYSFYFKIDGVIQTPNPTTGTNTSVTIPIITTTAKTFTFQIDSVFDANERIAQSSSVSVTINPLPTISGSLKVCLGSASQLTGSGTASPTTPWQSSNTAIATIDNNGLVNAKTAGSTTITYTNSNGCVVTAELVVNALPVVDFTFTDNQCSGNGVQFTPTVIGTGTYTYKWTFGDGSTDTSKSPTHVFNSLGCGTATYNVSLIVKDENGCSSVTQTKTITIKQQPDVNFEDVNAAGANAFSNCKNASASNTNFIITVGNVSNSSCATFSLDWGDGSSQSNVTFPITHTYSKLGTYPLSITAIGSNNCSITKVYSVKNVSNPSGGISSPGNTQNLCVPTTDIPFTITGWGKNSPGTLYNVNFGDGGELNFTQEKLNSSTYYNAVDPILSANYPIPHSYKKSNCPLSQYTVTLTVTNSCGSTTGTTSNITIISKPIANFSTPKFACVNSTVVFNDSTVLGFDGGCDNSTKFRWDFGDSTPIQSSGWIKTNQNASHIYTTPGVYNVTLFAHNSCDTTSKTQQITINPLPTATISGGTTVCQNSPAPVITFTGANGTAPYTFTYTLNGTAKTVKTVSGNNVTVPAQTTTSGTFIYSLISVQEGSSAACSQPQTGSATVVVNPLPTASISGTKGVCLGDSPAQITLTGANGTAPYTFTYNIDGGTSQIITTTTGNNVTISVPTTNAVTFKYNLISVSDASINGGCSQLQAGSAIITVNPIPTVADIPSQTKCNGDMSDALNFNGAVAGTIFNWTNDNVSIGLTSSKIGNINSFKLVNTSGTVQKANITVTPTYTNAGITCTGVPKTFSITVNPAPTITKHPVSSAVCKNGLATPLWVEYKNGVGKGTFQWYSNLINSNSGGTKISSTDSIFIPPTSMVDTLYYYCVVTLNMGGCSILTSNTASVAVTEIPAIQGQPTALQSICVGGTIKTPLKVNYTGGAGAGSCQWFTNTTNNNVGGSPIAGATNPIYSPPVFTAAGKYYFYAEITFTSNGCTKIVSDTARVDVVADPIIINSPKVSQTLCQSAIPVDLSVTANGGIGAFSYQWYSNSINNNSTGNLILGATKSSYTPPTSLVGTFYYYCIVSQLDGADCTVTSSTAEVVVNASPTFTKQPIGTELCLNGIPTTLSVKITNGVGSASYQWYASKLTSNLGAPLIGEINDTLVPPSNVVDTTYYTCVVSLSQGGCSSITSNAARVAITPIPVIKKQPLVSQDVCIGGTIAQPLTVSYTGGAGAASYQWYKNTTNTSTGGTLIPNATNDSFTPEAFDKMGLFYYYVEIKFAGSACGVIISDTARVNVVADPTVSLQPMISQTLCQNANPTDLAVETTGGIGQPTFQWYQNNSKNYFGTAIANALNKIYTPNTSSIGTVYYYCVVTQKNGEGCGAMSDFSEVIVKPAPTFITQPVSSNVCLGQIPSDLTVAYINGTGIPSYQWYSNSINEVGSGSIIPNANTSTFKPPYNAVGKWYYYCTVTLPSGGCSSITSNIAEVIVNEYPNISSYNTKIGSGQMFSITPNTLNGDIIPAGTTYTWSTPNVLPANSISGALAQTVPQTSISQLLTNETKAVGVVTYTVSPRSGNCVGADFKVVVTVNPPISPNATVTDITCYGSDNGSITTNIVGGIPPYNVEWTGPNGFISILTAITDLKKGDYTLKITDNGGLPFSTVYTIIEPQDIIVATDIEKDITCNGAANGEIKISVTGGIGTYKYTWTKNNVLFANTEDIANLSPGEYKVAVTDANNCVPKSVSFTITEPASMIISLINKTDNVCFGDSFGAVNIDVKGGTLIEIAAGVFDYHFEWSGPNGFSSNSQNLKNIPSGKYTLIVTDKLGCNKSFSVEITQPEMIVLSAITTPITCYGANNATLKLNIAGGVKPYQTVWDNFASGEFQDNLSAGDYTITVIDANNCEKTIKVNIPEAPIFRILPIVKNVSCYGAKDGSITLNFEGGKKPISLVWSDKSISGTTRNNIGPGTYTVTIYDGVPCNITRTFTIVEPQPLVLSAKITNAFSCDTVNSGAIDLLVSGGTAPYRYAWSNGATTQDLLKLPAGNYSVTVIDSIGCEQTAQYIVTRPLPISITLNSKFDYYCTTQYIKQISTATVSGGLPPYKIVWSNGKVSGANAEIMETNQSGIVVIKVTDALGCEASRTFEVIIPKLGVDAQLINCDKHIYQFKAVVVNELEFYSCAWDFGDGANSAFKTVEHQYVNPGSYKVKLTVTSSTMCVSTFTQTIDVEAPPVVGIDREAKFCVGDSILIHGTGAHTYLWSDGSKADSIMIKVKGDYSVVGTSKAGCNTTFSFKAVYFEMMNYTIQTDRLEVATDLKPLHLWTENIPFSNYTWDFDDGTTKGDGYDLNHTYIITKDGYFDVKLTVVNPFGCVEQAKKRIWIINNTVPNTFTPNGDGINDVYLKGWPIQVYNRNGVLLYEGKEGWDANYNGRPVANDTYFVIVYFSADGGTKFKTDYVTVIR